MADKTFTPSKHQADLDLDKFLLHDPPENEEAVPMDVLFVGAGPAGLAGAIELAKLQKIDAEKGGPLKEIEIGVLEKAETLGGHSLSGAVINPISMRHLFPDLEDKDFPFKDKVKSEAVYMMSETGSTRLPTPPTMHNKGNYTASLSEVVKWMGEKAEEMGINVFTSFPADKIIIKDKKVAGVRTTPAGLNRDGTEGSQYMPPTDITAKITVLSEGTRGPLSQAYMNWQGIKSAAPQIYALGVKEVWKVKKPLKKVIHTLGWPLPQDCFGGTWVYPMGEDQISIGLVAGLDYKQHDLDVHKMLQKFKEHPMIEPMLKDGDVLEWGAKTIPEGGYHSIPEKLYGDGVLLAGDCAGFVNVPALKGIHYAMLSGILAARSIYKALKNEDYTGKALQVYDRKVRDSIIYKDLNKVRNMRNAFKSGFYMGGFKSAVMTVTGGIFPGAPLQEADGDEEKEFVETPREARVGLSKVDAVYLSGNKTRDDIPPHLTIGKDISGDLADFYSAMCPAGVYERDGDDLVINAPNCVDCKATDVLGPRWQPREGGAGPNYTQM